MENKRCDNCNGSWQALHLQRKQIAYLVAKAELIVAEECQKKLEAEFLKERGFKVSVIFCIEDETLVIKLVEEFEAEPKEKKAWSCVCQAEDRLRDAENELIDYALSIIPMSKERKILESSRNNWKVREQLIDLAMKLKIR